MKKVIFLMVFAAVFSSALVAGDIPFFKSLFMGDEEYVKQELLKCKDVESVEIVLVDYDAYDEDKTYAVHVYLSNHRYVCFTNVDLSFYKSVKSYKNQCITLKQINDLGFWEQAFEPYKMGKKDFVYIMWRKFGEIRFLPKLSTTLTMGNMLEIIENIDYVYNLIKSFPEEPTNFSDKIPKFEWSYDKPLVIPEEFDNGIHVSIIERQTNRDTGKWFENGYKFYKVPIEKYEAAGFYKTDY